MIIKKVFLIVLDSFGIGNAPDAKEFNDEGANTFRSISSSGNFSIPNLTRLGIMNIPGVISENSSYSKVDHPTASYGRAYELSNGKDTVAGHFEIAGIISDLPFPTYPDGFPEDLMYKICREWGCGYLCNKPYSGTEVIHDYGREHIETKKPIVYTSVDSVFQIAAHEEVIPVDELYRLCETARRILDGEHRVARVIARPFIGEYPDYQRTTRRHDYAIKPEGKMLLTDLSEKGFDVLSVGKINDIFSGVGITKSYGAKTNEDVAKATEEILKTDFNGLCFVNFVEFDSVYGHRNDIDGYAGAVTRIDSWLGSFIEKMTDEDAIIVTADHGCDPGFPGTDHTREAVPVLVYGKALEPAPLGTFVGFDKVGRIAEKLLTKGSIY
ncbi:MAG: phosphopentomutase [Ruminococcaceae bacterium]|nr:phosphopentomutase [Oscillospiraceae bacterium]